MRKQVLYFLLAPLLLSSLHCSSTPDKPVSFEPVPPSSFEMLSKAFAGLDGCFLLYDMNKNAFVEEFHPDRCKQQLPACSTFKVPLAVAAFDAGILKDENTKFKWDGKKRELPNWNHDQTASSWMANSVVWYSQRITTKMGRRKVQDYLSKFNYGNRDFSGGLTNAWLTNAHGFDPKQKTSVLISGYEQIDFMKKLWTFDLPVSPQAIEMTRRITFLMNTPRGFQLYGKTGSGYVEPDFQRRLGWFIAHIEGNNQKYLAVINFNDKAETPNAMAGGPQAKQLMIDILRDRGLY